MIITKRVQVPELQAHGLRVIGARGTGTNFVLVRFAMSLWDGERGEHLLTGRAPALVQSYTLSAGTANRTKSMTSSIFDDLYFCFEPAVSGGERYCRPASVGGKLQTKSSDASYYK